jgi:hypothetical protein
MNSFKTHLGEGKEGSAFPQSQSVCSRTGSGLWALREEIEKDDIVYSLIKHYCARQAEFSPVFSNSG